MNILFLDFDGVLNPVHYENMMWKMWKTSNGLIKSKDEYGMIFFDQSIEHLKHIVEQTKCIIVISSTWRKQGYTVMENMWKDRNMPGLLSGITPIREDADRGKEIQEFINTNCFNTPSHNYAILDDRVITGHDSHFVKTNGYYGLTSEDAEEVINILKK